MKEMKEDKHIDDMIRQKLENYAVFPPAKVWENVQKELALRKQNARKMYLRWIAAAAVVLLGLVAGWYFTGNSGSDELSSAKNEQVKTKTQDSSQSTAVSASEESKIIASQTKVSGITTSENQLPATAKNNKTSLTSSGNITLSGYPERNTVSMKYLNGKTVRIAEKEIQVINLPQQATGREITPDELSQIDQLIIAENIKSVQTDKKETERWKMGMYVSPGYSGYNASYDENYAKNMTNSGSQGSTNLGGGFSVQYKTGKRWMIESGVYYAQNEQSTGSRQKMYASGSNFDYSFANEGAKKYTSNIVTVQNGNVAMNSIAGVIQLKSTPQDATILAGLESAKTGISNLVVPAGEFSQQFEFMEIPVYIRYRVLDKRFGIELLTGFNSGILIGNNAYIENEYGSQNVGKTIDISTFNLSATAGIGTSYELGKRLSVSVEPRFSYSLNSVNNSGLVEFRPYRIGIYTGLTYGF